MLAACGSAPVANQPTRITVRSQAPARCATVRTHYIAADSVDWNYLPTGKNLITGKPLTDTENVFMQTGEHRIGATYTKSLYREYTDETFTHASPIASDWQHLGMLGPVIHAEVGDTIRFVFKNNTPFPTSVHPHGVLYTKSSEGAPYDDGTGAGAKADDSVAPGAKYTYVWQVPGRAGPAAMDSSSVMWMYHSHSDEIADTYAGLMGPMIVTRCGNGRTDGSPKDVDREIVNVFTVENENLSPWLQYNINKFAAHPGTVDTSDDGFKESNMMHSINGLAYGNLQGQTMRVGQHVRWYLMGMGTEVDLHTPHWHGNTVTIAGMRTDVASLLPATMVTADMVPDNPGTWLYHCHVNDHIAAGMISVYKVS